jgi:hypothetical protein
MNRIEQIKTRLKTTLLCIATLTAPNLCAAEDLLIANAKREIKIERRYLHFPIKNGAPKRVVTTRLEQRPGRPGLLQRRVSPPLELKLTATPEGPRLTRNPVKELAVLRATSHHFDAATLQRDLLLIDHPAIP